MVNIRRLAFIVTLVLLTAQTWMTIHTSNHGVLEHTHAGQSCQLCSFSKHTHHFIAAKADIQTTSFHYRPVSYTGISEHYVATIRAKYNASRAPPSYS